jgi:hypothetical protein
MAWYDFIAISGLDTSLTDEEVATTALPDENAPVDLAPCPAMYFEVFTGITGDASATAEGAEGDGTAASMSESDIAGLQRWIAAVKVWFEKEEVWLDAARLWSEASDDMRGDLPAPIPPSLPDLSEFISLPALIAQFGPWGPVIWVGLQIVRRIIEAWVEKRMNSGVEGLKEIKELLENAFLFDGGVEGAKASILKAGLLFTDVEDEKLKGALDRGFLKEVVVMVGDNPVLKTLSLLELMKMSIDDLAFVDAIIDFGAFRCHIKGKMIEY